MYLEDEVISNNNILIEEIVLLYFENILKDYNTIQKYYDRMCK